VYVAVQPPGPPLLLGELGGGLDGGRLDGGALDGGLLDGGPLVGVVATTDGVLVGEGVDPLDTGGIRYGPTIDCFAWSTVNQSFPTMPPVSPESGFQSQ
jgi:hypothetical protein